MVFEDGAGQFKFLPEASYIGTITSADGYLSNCLPQMNYSTLNVNVSCTGSITLQIFSFPKYENTTSGYATGKLVFEKTIAADSHYFKRFAIYGMYSQVKILNTSGGDAELTLSSALSKDAQFSSQTLLNSLIGVDADTSLIRVANNWNNDMVRNLHQDFQKVNIQGILDLATPGSDQTIGLNTYKFDAFGVGATALYLNHASTNDVSGGTGARSITIEYVDASSNLATLDFNMPAAAGLTDLGITGFMVHRVFTTSFGTDRKNDGELRVQNAGGTITFNTILAGENTSHGACYLVPANRQLVISTLDINAQGQEGIIKIFEYDYNQGVRYSLGNFQVDSQKSAYSYNINGLVDAGKGILVDYIPKVGSPVLATFINVMANGILCPTPDTFSFI